MPADPTTRPFELPRKMPVMVLDHVCLLPGGVRPLFIFEERYRQMLDHALRTDRMFGIVEQRRDGRFRPVFCACLVAASVLAADGTSRLILHGVQRVRITGWAQETPFRIAEIEPVVTQHGTGEEAARLAAEVLDLLEHAQMPEAPENLQMLKKLLTNKSPEQVCDLVASVVVKRFVVQRSILEEVSLPRRFDTLIRELERPGTL